MKPDRTRTEWTLIVSLECANGHDEGASLARITMCVGPVEKRESPTWNVYQNVHKVLPNGGGVYCRRIGGLNNPCEGATMQVAVICTGRLTFHAWSRIAEAVRLRACAVACSTAQVCEFGQVSENDKDTLCRWVRESDGEGAESTSGWAELFETQCCIGTGAIAAEERSDSCCGTRRGKNSDCLPEETATKSQ